MKHSLLMVLLVFIIFLTSCSSSEDRFDDEDIKISLINEQSNNEYRSYSIEIKNLGILEIKNIHLYLYYPIILSNGSKGNPFKLEGKTDITSPVNLKSGESIRYTIFAPIKEVFGDSKLLDFNHPQIELNGLVQQKKSEIPFEMSGGYLHLK
ncbi:hypothetical protein [Gorillibacterium sp. sgz5001074]|uniref:hypothetical protein n=1 Tax=Gorillibacterium sp. sgz5001074 TaxID=3446695 RepID=UPI003F67731A